MIRRFLFMLFSVAAIVGAVTPAGAQYMYLDSNGDGVHTPGVDQLNANGVPTTVDVWIRTDQNRDGSPVVCGTEPEQTVYINSYNLNLKAVDGTVSYSNFINQQSAIWTVHHGPEINNDNIHYWNGWGSITSLPPGVVHLATVTITGLSGTPRIDIVDVIPGTADITAFGSRDCSGNAFDNTLKLDGPTTRAVQGIADWFDWDGLGAPPPPPTPLAATVFATGGNRTVRLGSGKPQTCVQIEPDAGSFDVSDVDLSSIRMVLDLVEIPALSNKTTIDGDVNQNGVVEITACFSKDDLRVLFAGRPTGDYEVSVQGELVSGETFEGVVSLHVINDGGFLAASVSPNPLNPKATLRFATSKRGAVKVEMYDVQGRLVRTLLDSPDAAAGSHNVTIEGHDANGSELASGIYYVKVRTTDGEMMKAITILK